MVTAGGLAGGRRRGVEATGLKGRSEGSFERQDLKERILEIFILKRFVIFFFFSFFVYMFVERSEEEGCSIK